MTNTNAAARLTTVVATWNDDTSDNMVRTNNNVHYSHNSSSSAIAMNAANAANEDEGDDDDDYTQEYDTYNESDKE
jgi:hypothetical protein